ncbi:Fc.00g093190.m01.CDS01 [Cosmosporella sp. VM-42]
MASMPWPIPSGSGRTSREKHDRKRIVIEFHTKPRDYVPGSGPEMESPRLLPPRDSTAYVLDRILLASPGLAEDGKPLPKRMAYLVGWHDLPAARMFVPAMQVLEYVSPQALEEWEWQMELELDEERAKLEKEAAKNMPKPKKRGRPPAHSQIEAAVVAEAEPEGKGAGWPKKGVMSIATPTKSRLADFEELSDEDESPSRQLQREALEESMDVDSNEVSEEVEMIDYEVDTESFQDDMQLNGVNHRTVRNGLPEDQAQDKGTLLALQTESFVSSVVTSTAPARSTPKSSTAATPATSATSASKRTKFSVRLPLPKNTSVFDATPNGGHVTQGRFTPVDGTPPVPVFGLRTPNPLEGGPAEPSGKTPASKRKSQKSAQKPKKDKTPKSKPPPSPEGAEPVWEVQRLEDMEIYDVEGRGLVKYFKVRWEGDWPPEQNPSWEPEDNLPANLVRNYLKKGKRKLPAAPKKKSMTQSTLSWANGKQYKSVSEAFAGDADNLDVPGPDTNHVDEAGNEDNEDKEEFFIVAEEEQHRAQPRQNAVNWNVAGAEFSRFAML